MIYFLLIKNLCFLFNMQSKEKGEVEFFLQHTCPKLYPDIVTKQFITFTHTIHVPILIYTVYYKHVPMFSSHTLEINTVYLWNGYLIKVCCYCTGHIYYFEIMQVNKLGNLSRLLTSQFILSHKIG